MGKRHWAQNVHPYFFLSFLSHSICRISGWGMTRPCHWPSLSPKCSQNWCQRTPHLMILNFNAMKRVTSFTRFPSKLTSGGETTLLNYCWPWFQRNPSSTCKPWPELKPGQGWGTWPQLGICQATGQLKPGWHITRASASASACVYYIISFLNQPGLLTEDSAMKEEEKKVLKEVIAIDEEMGLCYFNILS